MLSIQFIAAILIGGVASVWGSILGAAFVFALPTALNTFSTPATKRQFDTASHRGNLSAILYGLLIIVFLLFEPAGIIGLIRRLRVATQRFEARRKGGETTTTTASLENESQLDVERMDLARRTDAPRPPN